MHVLWRVHVDKGWFVLCSGLSTRTQLRKTRTSPLLFNVSVKNYRVGKLQAPLHKMPTLDKRSSVNTLQTSLCLTTSQAWLPSHNSTLETGSVARSLAYSAGGSAAAGRAKGNLGGLEEAGVGKIAAITRYARSIGAKLTSSRHYDLGLEESRSKITMN